MRPTVIGVDARELLGSRTGVGRYLGELLLRWTVRADASTRHFILYTPEALSLDLPRGAVEVRVVAGGRGTWWEQTALNAAVRKDDPDVFFAPAYTAPVGVAAPLVVTVHDVSFSRHPEWFRTREGLRRRWLTRHTARRASVVLTVSEFSRREIQELYGVPAERITVVRNGVTARPAGPHANRERIVLYAGSIFNRRHLPVLISAFARASAAFPDARLVIVGENRTWPVEDLAQVAAGAGIADRVSLRQYASDEDLATLYATASVFAFLSEYEGFGLTPLEALSAGVPVVVGDTEAAREIYGEAALFVAPTDAVKVADALLRLLSSADARERHLANAPAVLARYSWDDAAAQTLSALERAARR